MASGIGEIRDVTFTSLETGETTTVRGAVTLEHTLDSGDDTMTPLTLPTRVSWTYTSVQLGPLSLWRLLLGGPIPGVRDRATEWPHRSRMHAAYRRRNR